MVNVLMKMLLRSRVAVAELIGVVCIVVALAMVAPWAAWIAVGVAALLKAAEWELVRAARPPGEGSS